METKVDRILSDMDICRLSLRGDIVVLCVCDNCGISRTSTQMGLIHASCGTFQLMDADDVAPEEF